MPRLLQKQEAGPQSQETYLPDALPINGMDIQAERRTHMRELTMARQEAERRCSRPATEARLDRAAREEAARQREEDLAEELARIDAEHQTWLRAHGLPDPPEQRPRRRLPPDIMMSG